jgi:hypothetical protein
LRGWTAARGHASREADVEGLQRRQFLISKGWIQAVILVVLCGFFVLGLLAYRTKAHVCNACHRKDACTDSDRGREIVRPLDPWPHSEAGRFHRAISLMLVALSLLIVVVEAARHHRFDEAAMLGGVLLAGVLIGRLLVRDFRAHPANFPGPSPAQGLGVPVSWQERR